MKQGGYLKTRLNLIAILPSPKEQWEEVMKLLKLVGHII
jgi:hypothetical protein